MADSPAAGSNCVTKRNRILGRKELGAIGSSRKSSIWVLLLPEIVVNSVTL